MAVIDHPTVTVDRAGWYPDPDQQHNLRYFDGQDWTDHVTHYGPTPCSGCSLAWSGPAEA
jgi:hypothetical protein